MNVGVDREVFKALLLLFHFVRLFLVSASVTPALGDCKYEKPGTVEGSDFKVWSKSSQYSFAGRVLCRKYLSF